MLLLLVTGCAQTPLPQSATAPVEPQAVAAEAVDVTPYRLIPLTRSAHADGYGMLSPDGTTLAYSSVRDGNRDLYLQDIASRESVRITEHPADDGGPPAWSKDAKTLYFRSKRGNGLYNIHSIDLKTRRVEPLTAVDGNEGYVDVSPDGESLVFHSERDGEAGGPQAEIYVLNLGDGTQERVTRQPGMRNGAPDWFPDGKRIINIARSDAGSSVQITDLSGRVQRELAATGAQDTFTGTLSPDGETFVFYSNREDDAIHLYALTLADERLTRLTVGRTVYHTPSFSPDGRSVLVQTDDGTPSDLVLLDLTQPVTVAYALGRDLMETARTRAEFVDALAYLEQAIDEDPAFGPAHLWSAVANWRLSRWDEAREQLEAAESRTGSLDPIEALWLDAMRARVHRSPHREIEAWQAVLDADPGDRWAAYELAWAHMLLDDFPGVVDATDRALALVQDNALWESTLIHYIRSKALFRMGEYEMSAAAAELGRDNVTTWRPTLYRLAMAQLAGGEKEAGSASLEDYKAWTRQEGLVNEAALDINVALFYYEIGDYENAERLARRGLAAAEGLAYAHWALGYVLMETGDTDEGADVLEQGLAASPDHSGLHEAYGWAMYRQGRYEKALEYLDKAQSLAPRYNHLIRAHRKIVEEALADPGRPAAPPTKWLS